MIIYAYILCWNEEKILPFTLDHYSHFFDKIYLLDNHSTDRSVEIAKTYEKVEILQFQCTEPDKYDDVESAELRSSIYKSWDPPGALGKADWCIFERS